MFWILSINCPYLDNYLSRLSEPGLAGLVLGHFQRELHCETLG